MLKGLTIIILGSIVIVRPLSIFSILGSIVIILGSIVIILGSIFIILGSIFIILGSIFIILWTMFVMLWTMFMMLWTMFLKFFRILSSILIFIVKYSTSTFRLLNWIVLWNNRSIIRRMLRLTRLFTIVLCRDRRIIMGLWQVVLLVLWLVLFW